MKAFIFPGQGSQYVGMGKTLFEEFQKARQLFEEANRILGFKITDILFSGSEEDLKQTRVTQPAIFLHSVALNATLAETPDMVAGHSLGEFSALVANGTLTFEDGLRLVSIRAEAMQRACDQNPGTMAAILGLDDHLVERICKDIPGVVVPANYNCVGQLVISGEIEAVHKACQKLKDEGAKRALVLPVGGAFHSPLMENAQKELSDAIASTTFRKPKCPIYQNVTAKPVTDPEQIKANLVSQLTEPVRWTQSVKQMYADGGTIFVEIGPGKVLQGLVKKIEKDAQATSPEYGQ